MDTESREYAKDHDAHLKGLPTSTSTSRDAQKIYQDIYQALGEESGIDLYVKDGIVTVCGLVDRQDEISWVVDRIREVRGVTDVKNELKVKPFNH